jgi:type IV pilus assembly protein PilQ
MNALRFGLIAVCAGLGIAAAVALALTAPPSKESPRASATEQAAAPQPMPPRPAAEPAPNQGPVAPFPPQLAGYPVLPWPIYPPQSAAVHPMVSDQIDAVEKRMEKLQREVTPALERLTEELQRANAAQQTPAVLPSPSLVAPAAPRTNTPNAPAAISMAPSEELPPPGAVAGPAKTDIRSEGDDQLVINIRDEDIRTVLEKLAATGGLSIVPSKSVTGNVTASLEGVSVKTALDVILKQSGYQARQDGAFLFVGTADDFAAMDRAGDKQGKRIYRPNYVTAAELKTLIEPLLTPQIGLVTVSSPSQVGIPSDQASAGGDAFAGNEVLMVRDLERVLCEIDHVIGEVDCPPRQVAIEAMIVNVKLSDTYAFGVDFELLRDHNNIRIVSGTPLANLANLDISKGGLKVGFLDSSLGVFLTALETIGDTNVVASPHLMCLNKQRAEILIGSQLGYVNTTVTETSSTQSVSFLEVGTQLRIRPFIASDGLIRMEVHPELSTGSVSIQGNLTLPNKETTQVTSNIMVRDGATVVIGGLIREDLTNNTTQIPLIGSAPWIGPLFRQKRETTGRTETIVLITPKIVSEEKASRNGEEAECDFLARQQIFAEKMSPISQRYLGRRYLRMAQAAYEEGNLKAANRLVHLAIHYDPLNREAINFRGVVLKDSPVGDANVHHWMRIPVPPCGAPGTVCPPDVEPWMIDELVAPISHAEPVAADPKPLPAPIVPRAAKTSEPPRKVAVDAPAAVTPTKPSASSDRRTSIPLPPPLGARPTPAGPAPRLFAPALPPPEDEIRPLLFGE